MSSKSHSHGSNTGQRSSVSLSHQLLLSSRRSAGNVMLQTKWFPSVHFLQILSFPRSDRINYLFKDCFSRWRICCEPLVVPETPRGIEDAGHPTMSSRSSHVRKFSHNRMPAFKTPANRNKAVAEGAASFYLQQFVSIRVAKLTYGTKVAEHYNESNPEHRKRSATVGMNAAGRKLVPGAFAVALAKVCLVDLTFSLSSLSRFTLQGKADA